MPQIAPAALTSDEIMARRIDCWLKDDAPLEQFADWLRGYGFPMAWDNDEPYRCLLRGLENLKLDQESISTFCIKTADFLDRAPAITHTGKRPEQVLYNLFMLAHHLHRPNILSSPLYQVYMRGQVYGAWMGVDLRVALRDALVENQIDQSARHIWESLFEADTDKHLLPGDTLNGFIGLFKMPNLGTGRRPDVESILWGLSKVVIHLDQAGPQSNRGVKLPLLINAVVNEYADIEWSSLISQRARKDKWKRWATGIVLDLLNSSVLALGKEDSRCKPINDELAVQYEFSELLAPRRLLVTK